MTMEVETAMLPSFDLPAAGAFQFPADGRRFSDFEPPGGGAPTAEENGLRRERSTAAVKVQKVYRSYRTRRRLADSAVVAEELWWQPIDYVRLNHSTISFFDCVKPDTAASKWNRALVKASKVGKGLSKDEKAIQLAFQHWIEAIDPRHRYGHNLHIYYKDWYKITAAEQPFFYWLDIGNGRDVELEECPRSMLRQQCIKYLGPQEREQYEYILEEGRIIHRGRREPLETTRGSEKGKWIFVMSTFKKLYADVTQKWLPLRQQEKKGVFHHSSFLSGGATLAAGRLIAENGLIKAIWAYSGHYRPTDENLNIFLNFLAENGINSDEVKILSSSSEDYWDDSRIGEEREENTEAAATQLPLNQEEAAKEEEMDPSLEPTAAAAQVEEVKGNYKRQLSGGLQSPRGSVSQDVVFQRINSKKATRSYQLGHQLSRKWSTGAGPRIGCVADYPLEVRVQALEFVNLSQGNHQPLLQLFQFNLHMLILQGCKLPKLSVERWL